MKTDILEYLNTQKNLPDWMRDFHDQKDLFKSIHSQWANKKHSHPVLSEVSWVQGHQFSVDIFLWWMGMHGYKLQKDRTKNVDFLDPHKTIERFKNERVKTMRSILNKE